MQKDKARDVARGVLPSTRRKGARDDKRNFHQQHRSAQRQTNHAILRHLTDVDDDGCLYTDPDLFEDFDGPEIFDGYVAATQTPAISWGRSMKHIVQRRRDADNLGPLFSWAHGTEDKKMAGWSDDDKRSYFKAILPDTLQGRHALGHIETELDLDNDSYPWWRFNRPEPTTIDNFRAALGRCLANNKARAALREAIYEAIPVAAHGYYSNLKEKRWEQARDENGDKRYYEDDDSDWAPRPVMVEVWVPRVVSGTCDDCSFLRNDPLATAEAVNRFVDIVWRSRRLYPSWRDGGPVDHTFVRYVYDYVMSQAAS